MPIFILLVVILTSFTAHAQFDPSQSRGNKFNPAIGINALILYEHSSEEHDRNTGDPNGLYLQELEMQFSSDIDAYFRGVALFSVHKEAKTDPDYKIEPEEIYAETISLPQITFKLGKFKSSFGKLNELHTHAQPFVKLPTSYENIVGEEGLADSGVSASLLLPFPWFSEFTVEGLQGSSETLFNSNSANEMATVSNWKNLWELTSNLTMEWGFSYANGSNNLNSTTHLYGSDLTFKWLRSKQGNRRGFVWSTEYLAHEKNGHSQGATLSGLTSYIEYQFSQHWALQYRFDYLGLKHPTDQGKVVTNSALLGFFPSEFSGLRLQYDEIENSSLENERRVSLQFNYSIGAHPAHEY